MIIPKVIHQIWEEKTTLPESFYQFSETWKEHHPSWEYILWNKLRMDSFIQEYFPNYIPILKKYKYDVQRWDVIRYLILYVYSGPISTTNSGTNGTGIPDETEPLILN